MSTCPCCGYNLSAKAKPRSLEQHKRFFALMNAVYTHWPESHERQFANVEELRSFLTIKAGYRIVGAEIPLTGMSKEKALFIVEAGIRGAGSYAIPVFYKDKLIIFKPKSIAFGNMTPADFNALNDAVSTVIEQETGIPAEQILRETEAAA